MVEIIKNANDTITFTCDDYILPCTLVKVEKVTDNSNYYCLWLNKNEFYLYNVQNKKFALNINTYREAKLFYKIENYSNYSRTFVAYRSDKEYAYILFEDGNYENYVFKNVGKENKGIRPVKGCNNKWNYYDVFKKVFLYNISKGLNLSEDEELGLFFNHNCYTIYKKDLYYKFIFFDKDKHKIYYSDKLEYIGETYDDKIISKIFNKNIYALLDYKNPTRAFGYYTSKPRYIDSKNIFIAKKINSYVIINNCREVSNCQWTDDNFIFHHDYILNKTETGILKLYNYSDGKEICTNWKNIRFDKDSQCIIADTDNKKNKKISKSDINKLSMLLYKESRKCFECLETSIRPIKEEKSKYIVNKLDDAKLELQIKKQNNLNKLPQCVDFLFFVENIKINNDGYIESNKARKLISVKNYICWVIKSKHAIAISEYLKTKAHKVVYYKENINSSIFNEQVSNNNAIRTNIKITNGESSLFKEIAKYSNKNLITKEKKNDKATIEKVQISDTRNSLPIIKRQTLPSNISICIFTNSINILDGIYIQQKEIHKELLFSSNVCWIANKEKSIVIAKYIGYFSAIESYLYKIQYCIENVNEDVYINDEQDYIYSEDFDVFAEWEIIRKLKCIVNTHNGYLTNNTENTYNNTMIGHHFELSKSTLEATFTIDDVAYTMKKNDVWINADIFSRRQFVQKKNLIAILLDSNSKILVENNKTFYEIIGEGKDNRFNQDFGPVNKAIRDNEKQIILFYKDKNGKLRFADEVICEGFRFENDGKKTIRKIIVFKLRPLNDTDLRKEENKTSEEEISNESILIEKIDSFDDEKQACLTQTISKDFSETDDSYTNNTKNEDKMKEEDIDVHAHLNKLYQTMSNLKELGLKINDDIINETNRLEEKIIKEKLLPTITSKITDVLSSIERDLTLIVNYTPKQPISFSISREHFANTEINTKFLEIANKEDNEENTEHVLHKKSAKSNLRITLPNGRIITHSTAVESLIEFISYVGAEKAQKVGLIRCKIPLISQYIDEKYRNRQKSIGKGLYLMTCTSTEAKKEDIEKIAGFYNMKINVEII